jgi:hypothetical protein
LSELVGVSGVSGISGLLLLLLLLLLECLLTTVFEIDVVDKLCRFTPQPQHKHTNSIWLLASYVSARQSFSGQ